MNRIRLKIAILAFVASTVSAWAGDISSPGIRNCTWCHGISGQGFMTAPRLAGQQPQYIENQLVNFRGHIRDNPFSRQFMWGAVAALRPGAAHDLASYFSMLPPKAANDGQRRLADRGRTIYLNGIPEANVVSCYACHGPNAEGIRSIPRLGGLAYFYLKTRLRQWGQGYHASASPMPVVASTLGPDDIEALASFLSFVR